MLMDSNKIISDEKQKEIHPTPIKKKRKRKKKKELTLIENSGIANKLNSNDCNTNDVLNENIMNNKANNIIYNRNINHLDNIIEVSNENIQSQIISNTINEEKHIKKSTLFNIRPLTLQQENINQQDEEYLYKDNRKNLNNHFDSNNANTIANNGNPNENEELSVKSVKIIFSNTQIDSQNVLSDRTQNHSKNINIINKIHSFPQQEMNYFSMNNLNSNNEIDSTENNHYPPISDIIYPTMNSNSQINNIEGIRFIKKKKKKRKKKPQFPADKNNNNNQQNNINQIGNNLMSDNVNNDNHNDQIQQEPEIKAFGNLNDISQSIQIKKYPQFRLEQQADFYINAKERNSKIKDDDTLSYPSINQVSLTSNDIERLIPKKFTIKNPQLNLPQLDLKIKTIPPSRPQNSSSLSLSYFTLSFENLINQSSDIQNAKNELNELNNQITLLNNERKAQRTQLKEINSKINLGLNNININRFKIKPSNMSLKKSRNYQIKLKQNSNSVDLKGIQLKNAEHTILILTKDKVKFQQMATFPNIKIIQSQSKNLTNQIKELRLSINELKHKKDEHLKCSRENMDLERDLRFALEDLKTSMIINENMMSKISQAEIIYAKSLEVQNNYNTIVKVKRPSIQSLDKNNRITKEIIVHYPLAVALFTNKENELLKEAYKNNIKDYNKLMKAISIIESLRDSKEIMHSTLIKSYINRIRNIEENILYENKKFEEETNKGKVLNTQLNDIKKKIKAYTIKLSELSIYLDKIEQLIYSKTKEIDHLHMQTNDIKIEEQQLIIAPKNVNDSNNDKQ